MIYVHVPFCRSFCTYCGFYSEICSRKESQEVQKRVFGDYVDAVCEEIEARRVEIDAARHAALCVMPDPTGHPSSASVMPGCDRASLPPDTLYIGGGTPSVLPVEALARIVRALGPATYSEFTLEVNPDDVAAGGAPYAAALRALGVNRISMGVQSFDDGILRWMNRRHDAAGAREAFRLLRAAGFDNVSIDLIFGLSQLSDELWESTVNEALSLHPEHISAYQLSIEEDSSLERMVADGRYTEASDEQCRRQYDTLCRMLSEAGYFHYEISNWALPGREAVHNGAYWRRVPYVGLGPAAHSFSLPATPAHAIAPSAPASSAVPASTPAPSASPDPTPSSSSASASPALVVSASAPASSNPSAPGARSEQPLPAPGVRSWNSAELARRDSSGRLARWHSESEALSPQEAAEETVMLALRTAAGISLPLLRRLSPSAPVDALLASGSLQPVPSSPASSISQSAPRVRIPEDHFFVSDDIIARLFPAR